MRSNSSLHRKGWEEAGAWGRCWGGRGQEGGARSGMEVVAVPCRDAGAWEALTLPRRFRLLQTASHSARM